MVDQLPEDPDAERLVLAAMMESPLENVPLIRACLSADDFTRSVNRKVFGAIAAISDEHGEAYSDAVAMRLKDQGDLAAIGGLSYLSEITKESFGGVLGIQQYVDRVKNISIRRRLIHSCHLVANKCCDMTQDLSSVVWEMETQARSAQEDHTKASAVTGMDIIEAAGGLDGFFSARPGIYTPWNRLNAATGGLSRGDLVLIGGRPSDGKSTLMMNLAIDVAQKDYGVVVVFTLEMEGEALMKRCIASAAGITFFQLKMGYMNNEDRTATRRATGQIAQLPIYYERKLGKTVMGIRGELRRLASKHKIALVCVDYLQRMRSPKGHKERRLEIAEITGGLKDTAVDFDVPLVLLSQLTRASAKENVAPELTDFIESGSIEADADLAMLLWRPDKKNELDQNVPSRAKLLVRKQRNGETPEIDMMFDRKRFRFYEEMHEADYRSA